MIEYLNIYFMNWEEYKVLAEKTLSTEFHCSKKDELLLHAVIGILTEIDELLENYDRESDPVNVGEELTDALWYLSIIAREYNLSLPDKFETSLTDFQIILDITRNSIKLLDFLKKKLYYNKTVNEDLLIKHSDEIIGLFVAYSNLKSIDLEKCFEKNINKLKARYGDKFSSDKAINRDLVTERKILEN